MLSFVLALVLLAGCAAPQEDRQPDGTVDASVVEVDVETAPPPGVAEPFSDLRGGLDSEIRVLAPGEFDPADIPTFLFNEKTVFEGSEQLQGEVLENGKNPGLGVRALHGRGITGEGVSVAIIDQNILLESPEFADRVAAYYACGGYEFPEEGSSMHGPAVLSILAGKTTGVAPEANVYYAAAPTWTLDAAYYADGLDWIVGINETLPEGGKIRVVSVSAAPSGPGSPFEENLDLWDEAVERAQAAGILVIDCRMDAGTGFVEHGFYDPADPDNIERARNGWANTGEAYPTEEGHISVPCDYRTTVEQYSSGDYFYRYGGSGGLSWGIPYASGVLALGWQVNPALSADEMKALLLESAYRNEHDELIIYPSALIEAAEATIAR